MKKLPASLWRVLWVSQWFSLAVAGITGIAWLAIDSFILHIDKNPTAKIISATLLALVGGVVALLLQVYGRLDSWLDMFTELDRSVREVSSLETRLLPSLYVSAGMKEFHAGLLEWHNQVVSSNGRQASPIEGAAWLSLADAYFRGERERIRDRAFDTTSDQYTNLVNDISQTLLDSLIPQRGRSPRSPLLRIQITGMLPEEFYNAPQIEYTTKNSQPIFFCHRWEDYATFYGREYRHDPDTQVRRYIVVRDHQFRRSSLSALSTFDDLLEETSLVVSSTHARSLYDDIDNEPRQVLERLLRRVSIPSSAPATITKNRLLEEIRSIHGHDRYGYWSIAKKDEGGLLKGPSLLEFFTDYYHGQMVENARYCVIDENAWAVCERTELLRKCFVPGWTPEIALFGSQDREQSNPVWHVGILGIWRPFTRDTQLRFLTAGETQRLYEAFNLASSRCAREGSLSSLKDVPKNV